VFGLPLQGERKSIDDTEGVALGYDGIAFQATYFLGVVTLLPSPIAQCAPMLL